MIKGFAYIAWQIENDAFTESVADGARYIAQEAEAILAKDKS